MAASAQKTQTSLIYRLYQWRLRKQLNQDQLPSHIAVIVDGNRRWAKQRMLEHAAVGHRAGAKKIPEFLGWCAGAGVGVVTLYLLSADNLRSRKTSELEELFQIIGELAAEISEIPGSGDPHKRRTATERFYDLAVRALRVLFRGGTLPRPARGRPAACAA